MTRHVCSRRCREPSCGKLPTQDFSDESKCFLLLEASGFHLLHGSGEGRLVSILAAASLSSEQGIGACGHRTHRTMLKGQSSVAQGFPSCTLSGQLRKPAGFYFSPTLASSGFLRCLLMHSHASLSPPHRVYACSGCDPFHSASTTLPRDVLGVRDRLKMNQGTLLGDEIIF